MQLEKGDVLGSIYEGDKLLGLWFANSADTHNLMRIRTVIAMEEVSKKRKTSLEDYAAATSGLCEVKPGPPQIGGFVLLFPSASGR